MFLKIIYERIPFANAHRDTRTAAYFPSAHGCGLMSASAAPVSASAARGGYAETQLRAMPAAAPHDAPAYALTLDSGAPMIRPANLSIRS